MPVPLGDRKAQGLRAPHTRTILASQQSCRRATRLGRGGTAAGGSEPASCLTPELAAANEAETHAEI